jgi:hypothetical protein
VNGAPALPGGGGDERRVDAAAAPARGLYGALCKEATMAEASMRTRNRDPGQHTKSEMNRNRAESFGGALTTRRLGASDSPGASSSRSRSSRSGAERNQSVMAGRAGSGTSGGAGRSRGADTRAVTRAGKGKAKGRSAGAAGKAKGGGATGRGKARSKKSR